MNKGQIKVDFLNCEMNWNFIKYCKFYSDFSKSEFKIYYFLQHSKNGQMATMFKGAKFIILLFFNCLNYVLIWSLLIQNYFYHTQTFTGVEWTRISWTFQESSTGTLRTCRKENKQLLNLWCDCLLILLALDVCRETQIPKNSSYHLLWRKTFRNYFTLF